MLYLLCGLPGSGKTTFRNKIIECNRILKREVLVVSPDEIRREFGVQFDPTIEKEVWELAYLRLKNYLENGSSVIFDATNITVERRKPLIEIANKANHIVIAVVFNRPLEVVLEQNRNRDAVVPEEVILRMAKSYVEPSLEEGIVHIINV